MTEVADRPLAWRAERAGIAADVFAASGLLAGGATRLEDARLRTRCGRWLPFSAARWHAPAAHEEVEVLAAVNGPVLDLACGPGRLVHHLVERGVVAVGVDAAPDAIAAARQRGVPALLRDLWGALPLEGSWRTVLLFDGNIGIGGQPEALLDRCRHLLAPGGVVLAEIGGPATGSWAVEARIEWGDWGSAWFPWATVSVDTVDEVAAGAALVVSEVHEAGGRWFATLVPASELAGVAA
jgi:SAM-dependent methyltransferase